MSQGSKESAMAKKRIATLFSLSLIFALSLTGVVWAQETGLNETFDDPALPGWEHSPNTFVQGGSLHIDGEGMAFYPGFFREPEITLRLQRRGNAEVTLVYH
jgi:hypothetical protein